MSNDGPMCEESNSGNACGRRRNVRLNNIHAQLLEPGHVEVVHELSAGKQEPIKVSARMVRSSCCRLPVAEIGDRLSHHFCEAENAGISNPSWCGLHVTTTVLPARGKVQGLECGFVVTKSRGEPVQTIQPRRSYQNGVQINRPVSRVGSRDEHLGQYDCDQIEKCALRNLWFAPANRQV